MSSNNQSNPIGVTATPSNNSTTGKSTAQYTPCHTPHKQCKNMNSKCSKKRNSHTQTYHTDSAVIDSAVIDSAVDHSH